MTFRRLHVLAALAAVLAAAAAPGAIAAEAPPAKAAAPAGADALPGVDLSALAPDQRTSVLAWAKEAFCYCGCPHTVDQCLRSHGTCRHAGRMARLAARVAKEGGPRAEIAKALDAYYGSFDRRAKLDVSRFGPPRGNAAAPVTLVEFSDFTCPFCQLVHRPLSEFVEARADRVKLFYKPFPIESHPGALDAAQAAEWARENGIFWPMHDALFERPAAARAIGDLADLARAAGGSAAGLRKALEEKTWLARVRESQVEARAAGIRGTPTLFVNGRLHVLSDFSEEGLEATLQDEEEWAKHGGWERD
ncbi:MAG TPA: thioredoxin domain-containing protein [Anaeromyxobacter sp.]|nr:thioredoxin domain-containing protein [Anaeromyxobacter sp.]